MPIKESGAQLCVLNAGQNLFINGGSDRYLLELGDMLTAEGHCVIPFATKHPQNRPTEWERFFPSRVNFERPAPSDVLRYLYSREAKENIKKILQQRHIDVAHLHIYYGQLTGSILSELRSAGVPIVQTLHEYKLTCPVYTSYRAGSVCTQCSSGGYINCLLHRCNRSSVLRSGLSMMESYVSHFLGAERAVDKFICVSAYQRDLFVSQGIPQDKLITVPNFVAKDKFSNTSGDGDCVLFFGRVERTKGVFELIEAAALLPTIPFKIAGQGEALSMVADKVQKRRLSNVHLLGHLGEQQLGNAVADARLVVVPSLWPETFGLTTLEAFAKGRPVIASSVGGIPEVISDGIDGLLVAAGDVVDLAAAIEALWADPSRARTMGKFGKEKAKLEFSAEKHLERVLSVYRQVCGK